MGLYVCLASCLFTRIPVSPKHFFYISVILFNVCFYRTKKNVLVNYSLQCHPNVSL